MRTFQKWAICLLVAQYSCFALSASPQEYVRDAIGQLRGNHINRDRVDWQTIEREAQELGASAATIDDAHAVIRGVIHRLGEPHTSLVAPRKGDSPTRSTDAVPPPLPRVDVRTIDGLGYIALPTFAGSGERELEFARHIRKLVLDTDAHEPCGWIVDLRWNEGGNMYPALLGLGGLVGEGKIGAVLGGPVPQYMYAGPNAILISDHDYRSTPSPQTDTPADSGPVVRGTREILAFGNDVDQPRRRNVPIAVVVGRHTSSSGEAIAVALMGRDNTRSFGSPTAGRSTANIGVKLSDGAVLIITYGALFDRLARAHSPRVEPDVVIHDATNEMIYSSASPAIQAAREWLRSMPSCAQPALAPQASSTQSRTAAGVVRLVTKALGG